ncbi:MAG: porin family protein [Bergeyella sp.]
MKKVLLAGLLLLSFMFQAQTYKFGVTGAVNRGSIVGVHGVSEPKWGGMVGAFANFSIVENDVFDSAWLYFQPQLEFSKQGEKGAWDDDMEDGYESYDMGYIAVPLYLKYFFHKGNMKRDFFVFAGPKFEFLVYSKTKEGTAAAEAASYGYDPARFGLEQKFSNFGFGLSLGAGLKISDKGEVFLRYDRGLSKVYPDYNLYTTYNRFIALGFNYYFKEN